MEVSNAAALGISFLTSTIIFSRRVLVLNKSVLPCSKTLIASWCTSLYAGVLFWLSLNALNEPIYLQFFAGVTSTVLAWLVYVLLVNDSLAYPSKSQWVSLFFHILTEVFVLLQVRLVLQTRS